jgi:hypothetical protein
MTSQRYYSILYTERDNTIHVWLRLLSGHLFIMNYSYIFICISWWKFKALIPSVNKVISNHIQVGLHTLHETNRDLFPVIYSIISILLTLLGDISNKQDLLVKSYLRSPMGDKRLSNLYTDLPGDTFNCRLTAFGRLSTPIFPIMDNVHISTHFFFVPNRLIWNNWERDQVFVTELTSGLTAIRGIL